MTISTTTIKNSYSGNDSTTAFSYTFKISSDSEMQVIIRSDAGTETVKSLTTHYTVSGAGDASAVVREGARGSTAVLPGGDDGTDGEGGAGRDRQHVRPDVLQPAVVRQADAPADLRSAYAPKPILSARERDWESRQCGALVFETTRNRKVDGYR